MNKSILFLWTFFLYNGWLCAQDLERVRQHLDTLCAPGLHGRGATFDGQKDAAVYLADRFRETGILPIQDSYLQKFKYDINTFPGALSLRTDRQVLLPGSEFIVYAASPSGKRNVKILLLDSTALTSAKGKRKLLRARLHDVAVVYDEKFARMLKTRPPEFSNKLEEAACLIELKEKKLTMGLSSIQKKQPVFEVLKEKFNLSAKTLSYEVEAKWLKNYEAVNVCGIIKGTAVPDSFLLISAHYDHLGRLGTNTYFPGANDNGSGVSMLLELADFFQKHPQRYSIVLIAFGAEEAGLIGSKYFTEHPLVALANIRFMLNLDLMGTGDEGMMVVNGTVFNKEFELLSALNEQHGYLPVIKKRGKAANSDHFFFTEKGVPAFFFYTLGGISAYHDVYDVPETLPLTRFREVFRLITDFVPEVMTTPR